MTGAPLRVAVVGAGRHGGLHARILSSSPGARLVAVCDIDPTAAAAAARPAGAAACARLADLPPDLDAASVAVPAAAHAETASALLSRGVAVLLEKPATGCAADWEALADLARRKGVVLAAGFVERFNPVYTALRADVTGGGVRDADAVRVSPFPFRSCDVGAVLDIMIHDLDLVLSLVPAAPVSVEAVAVRVLTRHEDDVRARVAFADGATAAFLASRVAADAMRRTRLLCDGAWHEVDYRGRLWRAGRWGAPPDDPAALSPQTLERHLRVSERSFAAGEPLRDEIEDFLARVRGGGAAPQAATVDDTLRTLRLAERILARLAEGGLSRGAPRPVRA